MAHKQSLALLFLAAIVSTSIFLLFPSAVSAASIDLAKTGQTTCYNQTGGLIDCAGTGQDGEYQKGIPWPDPRFTNNEDGTITDNLSGLTWLQDTQCFGRTNWQDALDGVKLLTNGTCGLTDGSTAGDWRMPNYLELISLANIGASGSFAWYESFGFIDLIANGYWSSTSMPHSPGSAAGYQFRDRVSGSFGKSSTYQTWPVKGVSTGPAKIWKTGQTACYDNLGVVISCAGTGQDGDLQMGEPMPDTRFIDNDNGTVTDNLTGLTWLQNANCFGLSVWSDALTDANNLADGDCDLSDGSSSGDWRLPNPLEIVSLSDFSQTQPAISAGHPFTNLPIFIPFPPDYISYFSYWTSSTWLAMPGWADTGETTAKGIYGANVKSNSESYTVWPVRDGGIIVQPTPVFADGFEGDSSGD